MSSQMERAKNYENRIHALKQLLAMQVYDDIDKENPRNYLDAKRVITVIRTDSGSQQTWAMVEEAVKGLDITLSLAIWEN